MVGMGGFRVDEGDKLELGLEMHESQIYIHIREMDRIWFVATSKEYLYRNNYDIHIILVCFLAH